jgi:hypothetical protein
MRISGLVLMMTWLMASTVTMAEAPPPLPPIESVEIGENRELRVNGEPFLPIMSWAQKPSNFPQFRELHFNTFMGRQRNVSPAEQAQAARAAGGYAVAEFDKTALETMGHPFLLAWSQRDEPDMPQRSEELATPDAIEGGGARGRRYDPKVAPAETAEVYRQARQADPSRPVFVTFTGHFSTHINSHYTPQQREELYTQFSQHADVLGFDIYPIYGHGRPGWLNVPGQATEELVAMGGGRKPVYAWIETSKGSRWMTYERQPDVLPRHTRFQVWGALIRGATAIGYFTHAWRPQFSEFAATPEMRQELARINAQITRLAPAILASPSQRQINVTLSSDLGSHFKATEHDGQLYVFAQNTDLGPDADRLRQFDPINPRSATATIRVEGLTGGTVIAIDDEERTIIAEEGQFTDEFGPLQERVYRIPLPR